MTRRGRTAALGKATPRRHPSPHNVLTHAVAAIARAASGNAIPTDTVTSAGAAVNRAMNWQPPMLKPAAQRMYQPTGYATGVGAQPDVEDSSPAMQEYLQYVNQVAGQHQMRGSNYGTVPAYDATRYDSTSYGRRYGTPADESDDYEYRTPQYTPPPQLKLQQTTDPDADSGDAVVSASAERTHPFSNVQIEQPVNHPLANITEETQAMHPDEPEPAPADEPQPPQRQPQQEDNGSQSEEPGWLHRWADNYIESRWAQRGMKAAGTAAKTVRTVGGAIEAVGAVGEGMTALEAAEGLAFLGLL